MPAGTKLGSVQAGQRPSLLLRKPEQDFLHFNFPNMIWISSLPFLKQVITQKINSWDHVALGNDSLLRGFSSWPLSPSAKCLWCLRSHVWDPKKWKLWCLHLHSDRPTPLLPSSNCTDFYSGVLHNVEFRGKKKRFIALKLTMKKMENHCLTECLCCCLLLSPVSRVDLPIFPGSSFQGFLLTSLSSFIHFIEIWTSVTEYGHVPVIVYVCGGAGGSNKDEICNPCLCLGSYCKGSRRKRLSFRTWIPGSRIAERVCETGNKRNQHGSASASWLSTSQAPARIQSGRDSCLSPLPEGLKSK